MTIVTKPKTEKKLDKPLEKPLVTDDIPHCGEGGECTCIVENGGSEVEAWVSSSARRRVSTATTLCVCFTVVLVMVVGFIGGVYLYQQFSQHRYMKKMHALKTHDVVQGPPLSSNQMARFHGWCGIPVNREALPYLGNPKLPLGGNPEVYKDMKETMWGSPKPLLREEFELDLEDENYEDIRVPDFGYGKEGRFIHDFKAGQTGIIDLSSGRCYVMPLNRTYILPPRTLFDLVKKMWMGYYNIDTRVVRENTRIVYPPVEDYGPLGVYITKYCHNFPTFKLRRISIHEMRKRSTESDNPEQLQGIHFVEFAGKNIIHLTIHDDGEENQ